MSIQICKENSESLLKKDTKDKQKKDSDSEGEELWFDLLQKLYEFEDVVEKIKNNERCDKNRERITGIKHLDQIPQHRMIRRIDYKLAKREK